MRSSMAASVEDFPEPLGPATRTIPSRKFAISERCATWLAGALPENLWDCAQRSRKPPGLFCRHRCLELARFSPNLQIWGREMDARAAASALTLDGFVGWG